MDLVFTHEQIGRYSRHVLLADFGREGLERVRQGSVLWAGFSEAVMEASLYLCAAGLGTLGVAFPGRIESSRLLDLKSLNPDTRIELLPDLKGERDYMEQLPRFGLCASASETHLTLAGKGARESGKRLHVGVAGKTSVVTAIFGDGGPCLDCWRDRPRQGYSGGLLWKAASSVVGSLLASQILKDLAGIDLPPGDGVCFDLFEGTAEPFHIPRDSNCPSCSEQPSG